MSPASARIVTALKALRQLGPARLAENGLYRLGLRLDWWKTEPPDGFPEYSLRLDALPPVRSTARGAENPRLLEDAGLILEGKVRLYGGEPVPLSLEPGGPLFPWADYERGRVQAGVEDIKDVWEPARFGWAVTLARAYAAAGDDRYAQAFWQRFEQFQAANPPYRGPNWTSGQEAAIRILTWAFAARVFVTSSQSTPQRMVSWPRPSRPMPSASRRR